MLGIAKYLTKKKNIVITWRQIYFAPAWHLRNIRNILQIIKFFYVTALSSLNLCKLFKWISFSTFGVLFYGISLIAFSDFDLIKKENINFLNKVLSNI